MGYQTWSWLNKREKGEHKTSKFPFVHKKNQYHPVYWAAKSGCPMTSKILPEFAI
jgi:hypothetical protein